MLAGQPELNALVPMPMLANGSFTETVGSASEHVEGFDGQWRFPRSNRVDVPIARGLTVLQGI